MSEEIQITWHDHAVQRERGCVVWFTGLSGSGKSTIANCVDFKLSELGEQSFILDGDNVRHGLNASPQILRERHDEEFAKRFGLGFSAQDREENIRRIGALSEIFCSAGIITLAAFVSPYRKDRDSARAHVESSGQKDDFIEVYINTPLEICEQRDPKGLYKKARAGEIKGFTGIDDPYEPPLDAELVVQTSDLTIEQAADHVIKALEIRGKLRNIKRA